MRRGMLGPASRVALVALLAASLVAGSTTAAFALWAATPVSTGSSATLGKLSASLSVPSAMSTTFSSSTPSVTVPLTLKNSSTITASYSTSVSASSSGLAQAIQVVAWPVASTDACTAGSAVGSSSVSGTWAAAPNLAGTLAASAAALWCVRSTPTSSAPASASVDLTLSLVFAAGSWRSTPSTQAFTQKTAAATPAIQCSNPDAGNYHARIGFDASTRPSDTYYGLEVAGTRVDPAAQGYTGYIDLAGTDLPAGNPPDGPTRVDVVVLDSNQNPTSQVAATGTVTLATSNGSRTVTCGG